MVGNVYIPPAGSRYYNDNSFDEIENEIRRFSTNCDICLWGDFNTYTSNRLETFLIQHNTYTNNRLETFLIQQ